MRTDRAIVEFLFRRFASLASLCFCLGLGVQSGCQHSEGEGAPPPTGVKIGTVGVADIRETSEYLATLKSRRSIILQPQIDGQVTQILVAAGDRVRTGDALIQIDPARQAALVTSEQSTRAAKIASLNYWKQQAERMERLHEGGAVSQQELAQARMSYQSAKADVAAMGAQVRQQKVQLQYYRVTAPADGIVGDIPVRVGDRVTPATRLTTIDNNDMLEAYISVPAERAQDLKLDMLVQLIDNSGAPLGDTKVRFISPLVNDETQSVLIKTMISNESGQLRAGQIVRARIVFGNHKGPVVPMNSVIRLGAQYFVFVVEETSGKLIAKQRPVALGELEANEYPVRAGVDQGTRIVISGSQKLHDNSPIFEEK